MKNLLNKKTFALISLAILAAPCVLLAAKDTLAIAPVAPTPALAASVHNEGKGNSLDQVIQSLDKVLVDRMFSTRKFDVVTRGDLKPVLTEQAFANSGNVDAADKNAAQQFKLAGAKFIITTEITGFKDYQEYFRIENEPRPGFKRVLSLSATAQILDSTTGKLKEPASCSVVTNLFANSPERAKEIGSLSDDLFIAIVRQLAEKIANRVVDVLSPAKIVDVTDIDATTKQVTINWGDGMFIAVGEPWNVFETKVKKDPDDPDSNIIIEMPVGVIEITSVLPKTSTARIIKDGSRIAEGNIVRRMPQIAER